MFTQTDYDKLEQIMAESSEHRALIERLLDAHQESLKTLSHEIRNPLTMISSQLQLIEAAHPEVHEFKYWDSLHTDISYMLHLLNDLSDYHRSRNLCLSALEPVSFFKQIALSFAASAADTDIEFTSYIAPKLPVILADAAKLRSVLINLLKNASEAFSGDIGGQIRLQASLSTCAAQNFPLSENPASPSCLCIQVEDNGCGIPAERLTSIFTPFVTYKQGGTGLGLPLSKQIIEAHHGVLRVTSVEGEGSIFTILLPVHGPDA